MKWYLASGTDGITEIIESSDRPKMWSEGGTYTFRSCAYDSREALVQANAVAGYPCTECGGVVCLNQATKVNEDLDLRRICSSCKHWVEIIESKDDRRVFVHGTAYYRNDYRKVEDRHKHTLGFGGSLYKIVMKDTGKAHVTNDLWCTGTIPERFQDRLPDNAEFIEGYSERTKEVEDQLHK